jgi:transcriptional regulator with XRE-family HTH domain
MPDIRALVPERLRQCRQDTGWTIVETAKRLTKLAGEKMTGSRYSNWENGQRMPAPEEIIKLGALFNKPPAWLQGFTDNDSVGIITDKYIVPYDASLVTRAGVFTLTQATDNTAYSVDYIKERGLDKHKLLSVIQLDNSMRDLVPEGAEVLLDINHRTIRGGDLFGIAVQGNVWIRSIRPELDGTFTLSACDQSQYPAKSMTKEQLEKLDIIGRVVRIAVDR